MGEILGNNDLLTLFSCWLEVLPSSWKSDSLSSSSGRCCCCPWSTWPGVDWTSASTPELWLWSDHWSSMPASSTLFHRHGAKEVEKGGGIGREGNRKGRNKDKEGWRTQWVCGNVGHMMQNIKNVQFIWKYWQSLVVSRQNDEKRKQKIKKAEASGEQGQRSTVAHSREV